MPDAVRHRLPRRQRGPRHRQHRLAHRRVDRRLVRLCELERSVAGTSALALEATAVLAEQPAELGVLRASHAQCKGMKLRLR